MAKQGLSDLVAAPPSDWCEQAGYGPLNRERRFGGHDEVLRLGEQDRPVREPRYAVVPESPFLGPTEVGTPERHCGFDTGAVLELEVKRSIARVPPCMGCAGRNGHYVAG